MKNWAPHSAVLAWTIAGASLLGGSVRQEVPPYWVGVSFLLAAAFILLYDIVVKRRTG